MKTSPGTLRILAIAVAVAVTVWAPLGAATAGAVGAAPDPKATSAEVPTPSALDLQARDLFREQRYADALAIYQRLRAETGHPTYVRNIGRCHQMMRQPAPAIDAFQTYLRDARDLNPAERTEIEGYIAEMQRLELTVPAPSNDGGSGGAPTATPAPAARAPAAEGATAAPGPDSGSSITRRWWFWTGIGVLVATTGIILAASSGQDRLPCPTGAVCP